jgi:hypothetical protein
MAGTAIPLWWMGDGGVIEEEFKIPRKFTFDEFHEMLKEYVNDPKAREALATYDAEANAGRGDLSATSCSDLASESYGEFQAIGWSILVKHGWPTYYQMIEATKQNHDLRMLFIGTGNVFRGIAKRLIRKTSGYARWLQESFQDEEFDVHNKMDILRLLKMWADKYPTELPYTLTGNE